MSKQIDRLINEALAIEAEEAKEAGSLGYMARAMVQATMPHRASQDNTFVRVNGAYTLTMMSPPAIGLPYGTVPRLLLAWLSTEAVKTQDHVLVLGNSLSDFMRQLDMVPTGGRWGSITRLKEQSRRLFSSTINCHYKDTDTETGAGHEAMKNFLIADSASLWWEPKDPGQHSLFESTVTLSEPFFEDLITSPVPIDMRALKALKKSPMALDIYCWTTYRMSYLRKPTQIPWEALQAQFGSGFAHDAQGVRNFKRRFLEHLKKIHALYPELKAAEGEYGLKLAPSKTHVKRLVGQTK